MSCNNVHACDSHLADLPEDQGGSGRHRCAGCAYDKGLDDGRNHRDPHIDFSSLPESQAGNGRHKSPYLAYVEGYSAGIKEFYSRRDNPC